MEKSDSMFQWHTRPKFHYLNVNDIPHNTVVMDGILFEQTKKISTALVTIENGVRKFTPFPNGTFTEDRDHLLFYCSVIENE